MLIVYFLNKFGCEAKPQKCNLCHPNCGAIANMALSPKKCDYYGVLFMKYRTALTISIGRNKQADSIPFLSCAYQLMRDRQTFE